MATRRISPVCNFGTLFASEIVLRDVGNVYIYSGTALSSPALRYNDVIDRWQFSNNGVNYVDMGSGVGPISGSFTDKFVEFITIDILEETNHLLPGGKTYTLDNGKYLDIYHGGQLLVADTTEGYDYQEVNSSTVKFHKEIPTGTLLTYIIRA